MGIIRAQNVVKNCNQMCWLVEKREAANQWSGHGRPFDQCNGALITDRHSARLSHWSAPLVIIKARILFIQNHSSFEFAFQSDINIVCIEVQCCVQVLMLCDQEPQILSQWFSAILLLCICVIHPAIKAHVLNIANFGATNQPTNKSPS